MSDKFSSSIISFKINLYDSAKCSMNSLENFSEYKTLIPNLSSAALKIKNDKSPIMSCFKSSTA